MRTLGGVWGDSAKCADNEQCERDTVSSGPSAAVVRENPAGVNLTREKIH